MRMSLCCVCGYYVYTNNRYLYKLCIWTNRSQMVYIWIKVHVLCCAVLCYIQLVDLFPFHSSSGLCNYDDWDAVNKLNIRSSCKMIYKSYLFCFRNFFWLVIIFIDENRMEEVLNYYYFDPLQNSSSVSNSFRSILMSDFAPSAVAVIEISTTQKLHGYKKRHHGFINAPIRVFITLALSPSRFLRVHFQHWLNRKTLSPVSSRVDSITNKPWPINTVSAAGICCEHTFCTYHEYVNKHVRWFYLNFSLRPYRFYK